jgi:hypothetical protein
MTTPEGMMSATSSLLIFASVGDRPVIPDTSIHYQPVAVRGRRYWITPSMPHPPAPPVSD